MVQTPTAIYRHRTSIECTLGILEDGYFNPISGDPLNGDACMNLWNQHTDLGRNITKTGVDIVVAWYGPPAMMGNPRRYTPLPPATCIDFNPWRLVITPHIPKGQLRVMRVEIFDHEKVDDFLREYRRWKVLAPCGLRREKLRLLRHIRRLIRARDLFLEIKWCRFI
jgi:hypothetical protein